MKKAELVTKVMAGEPLVVVEYRTGAVETISYRDKTTGRAASFSKVTHNVEAGPKNITVSQRLGDDQDPKAWVQSIKKGSMAVLILEGLRRERGVWSADGHLEALTE
jgi:hypothetical protein